MTELPMKYTKSNKINGLIHNIITNYQTQNSQTDTPTPLNSNSTTYTYIPHIYPKLFGGNMLSIYTGRGYIGSCIR